MCTVNNTEPTPIERIQDKSSVEKNEHDSPCAATPMPLSSLDELFSDRYTTSNQSYAKVSEGFDPVVCIYPFQAKQQFDRNKRRFDNDNSRNNWERRNRGEEQMHRGYKRHRPS